YSAQKQYFDTLFPAMTDLPLSILIDGESASASELLAGAFQDLSRAWVVGVPSFGKGTAQSVSKDQWMRKGLAYYETRNLFFLPGGRSPQALGIQPNFFQETRRGNRPFWRLTDLKEYYYPKQSRPWVENR